jgi:pseudouridine kinase
MADHVLVIGASLLDTKGKPLAGLAPGTSNPGHIRITRGGTARNVAENLSRLGAEVVLISAVGDDQTGRRLMEPTAAAGVNIDYVITASGQHSGAYIAFLEENGSLSVALEDITVMSQVSGSYLYQHRRLFREASMIMIDGNLSPAAIQTAVKLAEQHNVPLCADPSSVRLAYKLSSHLSQLHLLVPNHVEAAELCQTDVPSHDPESNLNLARQLNAAGVKIAAVTLADFGLVYASGEETGHVPARYPEMVDSTGAGDAIISAIMYGLLNGMPPIECVRLGAAAASLTLQTSHTVVPNLSLDMLYDHLTV